MGVKIRKRRGKWYVFVNYHGRRKAKCVGSREAAEQVRRQLEAKLALGEFGFLGSDEDNLPNFDAYADRWMKDYVRVECKTSTASGYEGVLRQYLRPRFGKKPLNEIRRDEVKALINDLIGKDLSRNTIRNALCVIRGMFNYAVEERLLEWNPAVHLGRFTRSAKTTETKGIALTSKDVQQFLKAAQEIRTEYHPLLLMAVRAGLRRGELVRFGGVTFSSVETRVNRTASSWCSTTTCAVSTPRPRARRRGGWICLGNSEGYSSNFATNDCWTLTWKARTTSPMKSSFGHLRELFSTRITSTIACFFTCWLRPASARFGYTTCVIRLGRC
jgi:hypothetical protein